MSEKFKAGLGEVQEAESLAFERAGFSNEEIMDYEELISRLDPDEADGITLVDHNPDDEARLREYTKRLLKLSE